ncbi:hypothetical protein [uncultured Thiodictyon sp.]|uniref:hypothetical protein n=1 Tax=uncultured Thiodictyon sp. TaxID=1846217 RepID=UPI0025CDCF2B|nr:hypothetical protein [uncultured Thiodictyon sp.]
MSGSVYDFLHGQWRDYKRRLHRVCAVTHAQALLDCICDGCAGCGPAQLIEPVTAWINLQVGRDLEGRIRAAGPEGDACWSQCLRLFHSPQRMAAQLARSLEAICAAWGLGEDARARAILWQTLSHYFYEARFAVDGPTGQHRLRNWVRIQRLLARVRRDLEVQVGGLAGPERVWTLRRLEDPAWLAAAVLAESQRTGGGPPLDDIATVDGVLAYLYAFLPHLDIGDMEDDPALAAHLPSDLPETIAYYVNDPTSPAGLTAPERAALILEYWSEVAPMSDRVFQDTYGHTRQTHRNRVAAGVRKIAPWVRRDLES